MTVCDRGEGVKNHEKKRDILYGRPLTQSLGILPSSQLHHSIIYKYISSPPRSIMLCVYCILKYYIIEYFVV